MHIKKSSVGYDLALPEDQREPSMGMALLDTALWGSCVSFLVCCDV